MTADESVFSMFSCISDSDFLAPTRQKTKSDALKKKLQGVIPLPKMEMACFLAIPETPSGDTNGHNHIDDHLGEENKEEDEEIEGAVTPREKKNNFYKDKKKKTNLANVIFSQCVFYKRRWWYEPKGFIHRSVPTDKGAGGEEDGPENGKAQANTTPGRVHAEHGQRGNEVEEQRATAD